MNLPPIAWVILALGILWLALRFWSRKNEEKRAEAREARMAELLAERERMLGHKPDDAPASLAAVVSDSSPPSRRVPPSADPRSRDAEPPKEKVCLGCRTVNPPEATTCKGCGLEL